MSSMLRNMERRWLKAIGKFPKRTQAVRDTPKGYETLHPTKGWMEVSAKRVEARMFLSAIALRKTIPVRTEGKMPPKFYGTQVPVEAAVRVTRQQRRAAARA